MYPLVSLPVASVTYSAFSSVSNAFKAVFVISCEILPVEEDDEDEEKALEFKKFLWDSRADMDAQELRTMMSDNDVNQICPKLHTVRTIEWSQSEIRCSHLVFCEQSGQFLFHCVHKS